MAKTLNTFIFLFLLSITAPKTLARREKRTRIQFYFHHNSSGPNLTAVDVASAPTTSSSPTRFGSVVVFDDPLTTGPDPSSPKIGTAQGIYASASQTDNEVGFAMAFNFVFTTGRFKGSTLSVLGRNPIFDHVREMPILGGTGRFRLARGFAIATTHSFNVSAGNAIVKYELTVLLY